MSQSVFPELFRMLLLLEPLFLQQWVWLPKHEAFCLCEQPSTILAKRPRNYPCRLSLPASPLLRCQAQPANEASGCELLWAWAPTKQSHKPSVGLATDDCDTSLRSSRVGASLNPEVLCSAVGLIQPRPGQPRKSHYSTPTAWLLTTWRLPV